MHGGAHKLNNTLGQGLLASYMGKKKLIAETGAGQHGLATATVGAFFGMEVKVFMGVTDIERQKPNVEKMQLLGAEVIPVTSGDRTLHWRAFCPNAVATMVYPLAATGGNCNICPNQ